jgi:hypothetical protein
MTRRKHPSLWTPAFAVLTGSAVAAAFGIRQGWTYGVIAEIVALLLATALYFSGGQDTDAGAILAHRADERQQLVRLKASRLTAAVAVFATVVAFVIAVAVKAAFWPFEVIYLVTCVSYLVGLGLYGAKPEEADAEDNDYESHQVAPR